MWLFTMATRRQVRNDSVESLNRNVLEMEVLDIDFGFDSVNLRTIDMDFLR